MSISILTILSENDIGYGAVQIVQHGLYAIHCNGQIKVYDADLNAAFYANDDCLQLRYPSRCIGVGGVVVRMWTQVNNGGHYLHTVYNSDEWPKHGDSMLHPVDILSARSIDRVHYIDIIVGTYIIRLSLTM